MDPETPELAMQGFIPHSEVCNLLLPKATVLCWFQVSPADIQREQWGCCLSFLADLPGSNLGLRGQAGPFPGGKQAVT